MRRLLVALALLATCWACAAQAVSPWLDTAGQPTRNTLDALQLLQHADAEGLVPADYAARPLAERAAAVASADPAAQAAFTRDLQAATLHYLHDLHQGRVSPASVGMRVPPRTDAQALPDQLARALAEQRLPAAAAALAPQLSQYALLREQLARYRRLAADTTLAVPEIRPTVRPDAPLAAAAALRTWLIALGDLPETTAPATDHYDSTLADGVRHFQQRHGLAPDGVLGRATVAELTTPLPQRVRQIELAMERLRWLAPLGERRFVAINIPMFRLWAWDPAAPGTAPLAMNVIVGKSLNTQTPVLQQDMRYLIFRPYWNVPRSILLKELLPQIRRNPATLQREDLEIVRGGGDDATPVPASADNLALLQQGALRLRQRPGARNSLGLVKFVFPNDADVYLHGTPAQALFARPRRDFSHGCVRVEDPVALAQWVLADAPAESGAWTRERIEAAMAAERSQRVTLARAIPVLLFYTTAVVLPDDGLHFAADIYGHDRRLAKALTGRR